MTSLLSSSSSSLHHHHHHYRDHHHLFTSLRSRRWEVVGTRKNRRARRRHARGEVAPSPLACLPRAHPFSLSPTTSKRLLRRLSIYIRECIRPSVSITTFYRTGSLALSPESSPTCGSRGSYFIFLYSLTSFAWLALTGVQDSRGPFLESPDN